MTSSGQKVVLLLKINECGKDLCKKYIGSQKHNSDDTLHRHIQP